MQRHLRLGATLALSGLLAAGVTPMLATAADAATTQASTDAASWLASAIPADGLLKKTDGSPDYDASIDAALALKTAANPAAQRSADAVANGASAYTEYSQTYADGTYIGTYAGHAAKALALELALPPTTAPGCDHYTPLVFGDPLPAGGAGATPPPATPSAEGVCYLTESLIDNMSDAGQIQDTSSVTKSDGVHNVHGIPSDPQHTGQVGQAYAALALSKVPSDADPSASPAIDPAAAAAKALGFLKQEQASTGAFCVDQTTGACTAPDVLTTAEVVLQLQQISGSADAAAMVNSARAWLATQQHPDGSFGPAVTTATTGAALSGTYNAQLAAVWLRQNQADELAACPDGLTNEKGAVAMSIQARNVGRASGIADSAKGDWERATTAAIPALASLPAQSAAGVTFVGPSGFRKAGAQLTYNVGGEAPGDLVCITGPDGALTRGWADVNGNASIDLILPNRTVDATYVLHDRAGDHSVVTRVLGPKRFSLSVVKQKRRGRYIWIKASGLQPGESYYLKFRSTKIKRGGRAPASGAISFHYRISPRAKLGKAKVTIVGQTGDRNAVRWLKVLR